MINKKLIVLGICILAVFGGIIAFNIKTKPEQIETLNAFISSESVSIQSGNSGIIKNIQVKQSDKVQKGQVLAEIETSVPVTKTVKNDGQKLKQAEEKYENAAIMYKDGVISQAEYDRYLNNLEKEQNNAEKPQNKVILTSQVTKIYAPIDGVVVLNNLKNGDTVNKEAIIAKVNSSHKEINAYFPVSYKDEIKTGCSVNITVIKFPEKTFTGKIQEVSLPDNKGIPVKISFDQDTSNLDFLNGDSAIVKIK